MVKLSIKFPSKRFILSQIILLIIGLSFIAGFYFISNTQQKTKDLFSRGPVTSAPKSLVLTLDQPEDDSLTFAPSVVVSGKTAPRANVLISTEINDLVIQSKQDGSFSTVLNLDNDVNTITAVVFDSAGDSRSASRTVYYSKEKI